MPPKLCLILLMGVAGTGKSTLAREIVRRIHVSYLDNNFIADVFFSDTREGSQYKKLRSGFYKALYTITDENLKLGNSVLLDAPHIKEVQTPEWKQFITQLAGKNNAKLVVIRCHCSEGSLRARIHARGEPRDKWKLRHWKKFLSEQPIQVSIPFPHLEIDTDKSLSRNINVAIRYITDQRGYSQGSFMQNQATSTKNVPYFMRSRLAGDLRRPTQAVILAGGRGTRLRPITDTRPKPMVAVHGKPFLEYQIEQLRDQGFEKVLLLLGYLPESVQDYVGDGRRWGVKVEYSVTAIDDQTARRLKLAAPYLDPCFLLLYCDNYWPMQLDKMWARFVSEDVAGMITVYSNKDGYTRSSVRVDEEGFIVSYDKSCTSPGLQGVEISYAILTRPVLELLPDENVLLEETLYPELARRRRLLAYVTDHRYYSIGALHRLPLTEAFFARTPTIILDRDGVLNKKPARAQYVRSPEEFQWLPGAKEALRLLKNNDYRVVVVSNQAGIGRGFMKETDLAAINKRMVDEAKQAGGKIDAVYYCPHDWEAGCECRKPKPGLFFQAQKDLHLDLTRILFIGDDERDGQAAEAASCRFEMVTDEKSLLQIIHKVVTDDR